VQSKKYSPLEIIDGTVDLVIMFVWTQFWQIVSFIALIVAIILCRTVKNKQTEQERLTKKVEGKMLWMKKRCC
jgi:hypothetical protein